MYLFRSFMLVSMYFKRCHTHGWLIIHNNTNDIGNSIGGFKNYLLWSEPISELYKTNNNRYEIFSLSGSSENFLPQKKFPKPFCDSGSYFLSNPTPKAQPEKLVPRLPPTPLRPLAKFSNFSKHNRRNLICLFCIEIVPQRINEEKYYSSGERRWGREGLW